MEPGAVLSADRGHCSGSPTTIGDRRGWFRCGHGSGSGAALPILPEADSCPSSDPWRDRVVHRRRAEVIIWVVTGAGVLILLLSGTAQTSPRATGTSITDPACELTGVAGVLTSTRKG
jgi:hypothetical protein